MKYVFGGIFAAGLLTLLFTLAAGASETDLIASSWFWVNLMVFGGVGFIAYQFIVNKYRKMTELEQPARDELIRSEHGRVWAVASLAVVFSLGFMMTLLDSFWGHL